LKVALPVGAAEWSYNFTLKMVTDSSIETCSMYLLLLKHQTMDKVLEADGL
jgi:hypothetical protein